MNQRSEINYVAEKTSFLVSSMFSAGAVAIDDDGIVKVSSTIRRNIMAFVLADFSPLGGQSKTATRQLCMCTTTEAHTAVDASGYFNDLSDTLVVGDMIVHGATGGTRTVTMHVVVSNASGVVDISDGTTIGAVSDSD